MEDLVYGLLEAKLMIKRLRMRLVVAIRTKGETIPIISIIKTIKIREEEGKDKDLEEEASVENFFTAKKKGIENLNVPNAKEGKIKEPKARLELHMLMKMLDHYILKMLNEEKS